MSNAVGSGRVDPPHYGLVYYLHRQPETTDADNISKPVWDALRGLAYEDDTTVRLRIAGKLRLLSGRRARFDLSRVPTDTAERLATLIGKQGHEHILYVELGALKEAMFTFGLAG